MWSYHSQDPASEEELATLQHERMGASSLNFLGGLDEERVEEGTQSFSLLSDNVSIIQHPLYVVLSVGLAGTVVSHRTNSAKLQCVRSS